jgi:hypothetical protein
MDPTLYQLQREITSTLRGLDTTQTQLRPPTLSGKWSIQQIMEHLLLTYSFTELALNARIAKRSPTKAKATATQKIQQYAVFRLGYYPHGRQAPAAVTPGSTGQPLSGDELTRSAGEHLIRLDALCTEAERLFGNTRCASHTVLGPLCVDNWRMFQLLHGRHHLKQISAIRNAHDVQPSSTHA